MYIVIGSLVLIVQLLASAEWQRRRNRAFRQVADRIKRNVEADLKSGRSVQYADYSGFDQDRILMNRSERW